MHSGLSRTAEAIQKAIDAAADTDATSRGSRLEELYYMRKAPELGTPVLYWLSPGPDSPILPEDWEERRVLWDAYRKEWKQKTD